MANLTNVKVTTSTDYTYNRSRDYEYYLNLEIPLPGGVAIYKTKIDKKMYDSLEKAQALAEVAKDSAESE